jgi:hypothetical protein
MSNFILNLKKKKNQNDSKISISSAKETDGTVSSGVYLYHNETQISFPPIISPGTKTAFYYHKVKDCDPWPVFSNQIQDRNIAL